MHRQIRHTILLIPLLEIFRMQPVRPEAPKTGCIFFRSNAPEEIATFIEVRLSYPTEIA
jgi:hypothetical protein